jgi:hypothetical protein
LSGSATSLLQSVEGQPQLVDLFAYGLSDEFFQARQALKVAVDV